MKPQPWLAAWLAALLSASPALAQIPRPDNPQDVLPEPAAKLQALLKADTTNPPGNEARAIALIAGWLKAEGIPYEVFTAAPGRQSLVARLDAGPKPDPANALLLLGHVDVVPVEPARWTRPPFGGVLDDGKLWGRGALDMKGQVIMELLAFLELKRQGVKLRRDVIFAATADEEAGGDAGVRWLIARHPQAVRCSELLNEGGSGLVLENGRAIMGIQVAERGTLWARVTAHGTPGHGSAFRPDAAPRKLLQALARLDAQPCKYEIGPESGPMLRALAGAQGGLKGLVLGAMTQPWLTPLIAPHVLPQQPMLGALLGTTMNPTVLAAGKKVNVIPGEASAELDLRMLPGHSVGQTLGWLRHGLGDPELKIEVIHAQEPSRSPASGVLYQALADASRAEYPDVPTTPILTPGGGTDSAAFRPLGVKCYGCMPILATAAQLASMHGDDEHIGLDQLAAGTRVITAAVRQAAQQAP